MHSSSSALSKLYKNSGESGGPTPPPRTRAPRTAHRQGEAHGRAQHAVHVEPGAEEAHAPVTGPECLQALEELWGQVGRLSDRLGLAETKTETRRRAGAELGTAEPEPAELRGQEETRRPRERGQRQTVLVK